MFKEKKSGKAIVAIILVMCLTFANCFTLFSNLSYAADEALGKQATESSNVVDFNAEFVKEDKEKSYEFEGTIDEENLSLQMQIEVKKEGYLKNAKIQIESENGLSFEISQEQVNNYQINGNSITLSNITAGEKIEIKLPIKYRERDDIENLNKKVNVKLIGTYVNGQGKEKGISQNVLLKLVWHTNTEYTITSELKKYITFGEENKKVILQTNVKTWLPTENNFVSKEELTIDAINVDGYKIEKVIVADKEGKMQDSDWSYNADENKITIKIENEKEAIQSDEFLITYIMSGNTEIELPFKTNSKINGSIFMFGTDEKVETELDQEYEINEELGNTVSVEGESTEKIKAGNILVDSLADENNSTITYSTKINVDISSTEMCEGIKIQSNEENFENAAGLFDSKTSSFRTIEVAKESFNKILGEDGKIEIKNEAGELISTINKNTKIENDNYKVEINTNQIQIVTSKPVTEGILPIVLNKELGKTEYTYDEIKTFSNIDLNYTGSIIYAGEVENKVSTVTNKVEIEQPKTNAELAISRNTLSTIADNNDIELEVKLNNVNEGNDVYQNPRFQITFPEYIEEVNVSNIAIANSEDVFKIASSTISKNENGNLVLDIILEGNQTKYNSNKMSNGTSILVNCNIRLNLYTPTSKEKITLTYENERASQYQNEANGLGYSEVEVEYKAPVGVVSINRISNYETTGKTITSVDQGKVTDKIEIFDEAKIATMDILVMNNNENDCNNIKILGRTPFKGNKDVSTGEDLGTTVDAKMVSSIIADENNQANAIIYYSDNGDATEDLENESNNWTTDIGSLEMVKSYLIVLDNYEMKPGEIVKYSYQYEIPENLEHNANIYGSFKTIYDNLNNVATVKEESNADIVGLSTGVGPQIAVKTVSNVQETVKEYEKIKYIITVENTGSEVAENIKVNTKVPTGATVAVHSSYSSVEMAKGWTLKSDREITTTFEKINPGEVKKIEFFVQANKLPTIEEYYAGEEGFTKNDDGTYSINESYVDENGETKYADKKIDSIPEIKLVCESTITAKDLAKEIKTEDSGIVVKKSNLVAEETVETEDSVAKVNETIESKIQIKNNSSEVMKNIKVTKVLPTGLNYSESYIRGYADDGITLRKINTTNYDMDTRTVTWNIDELKPGRTVLLIGDWVVGDMKNGTYKETVSTNSNISVNGENYQAGQVDITIGRPNLEISQASNKTNEYIKVGDEIEYTFTIKNTGAVRANNVILTDKLPDEVSIKKLEYKVDGVAVSKVVAKNEDATVYTSILPEGTLEAKVTAQVNDIQAAQKTITNIGNVEGQNIENVGSNKITNIIERTADQQENEDNSNKDNNNNNNSSNNTNNSQSSENIKDKYEIKGTAWLDENKNGSREATESKLAGIEVKLINSKTSEVVDKTVTDQDGEYKFSNLNNGTYIAIFYYDNSKYALTEYKKQNVSDDKNSDVITGEENNKTVATTEVITIENGSISNIDLGLIKATTFDLALTKAITKVTVQTSNGTKSYDFDNTDLAKVDINAKYLNGANVLVEYTFTVKNEGELEGYAKQIVDYMPKELEFNTELNKNWYKGNDGNLYTEELTDTSIAAGESKTVKLVLTKAMTETNTGIINNQAEISKDYNQAGVADQDSTPGDQDPKDDDMSSADLIIGVKTGETLIYISAIIAGIIAAIVIALIIKKSKIIYKIQYKVGKGV